MKILRLHMIRVMTLVVICLYSVQGSSQELSVYNYGLGPRYYLDGDKISRKNFINELRSNKYSDNLYKEALKNKYISYGAIAGQLFASVKAIDAAYNYEQEKSLNYLYASFAFAGIGIYFNDKFISYRRKAIHEYNNPSKKPKFTLLSSPNNLIGIAYSLDNK